MVEKQVKDWALPLMVSGLLWISLKYAYDFVGPQVWLLIIIVLAVVSAAAAMANLWEYLVERQQSAVSFQQQTLTHSADARLLEEARLLAAQSPELASELAHRIGRPDLILYPTRSGRKVQIKLAGSEVTLQFALYALQRSTDIHFVAQRDFSDGAYSWDPNRDVTDRQQWQQFNFVLAREGICQRYVPGQATNTAPMWLPPWTPQRVLELWLLPSDLVNTLKPFVDDTKEA